MTKKLKIDTREDSSVINITINAVHLTAERKSIGATERITIYYLDNASIDLQASLVFELIKYAMFDDVTEYIDVDAQQVEPTLGLSADDIDQRRQVLAAIGFVEEPRKEETLQHMVYMLPVVPPRKTESEVLADIIKNVCDLDIDGIQVS